MSFVRTQLSLAILRATGHCLRGARKKMLPLRFEDGSNVTLLRLKCQEGARLSWPLLTALSSVFPCLSSFPRLLYFIKFSVCCIFFLQGMYAFCFVLFFNFLLFFFILLIHLFFIFCILEFWVCVYGLRPLRLCVLSIKLFVSLRGSHNCCCLIFPL